MRNYPEIGAAASDVQRFFYVNQLLLPEPIAKRLETHVGAGASPVDLIVTFTESVYANRGAVPKEAMEIAAGCADLINQKGYHGRLEGRANAMVDALRRDSGEKAVEGSPWRKPFQDLAPNAEFVIRETKQ